MQMKMKISVKESLLWSTIHCHFMDHLLAILVIKIMQTLIFNFTLTSGGLKERVSNFLIHLSLWHDVE